MRFILAGGDLAVNDPRQLSGNPTYRALAVAFLAWHLPTVAGLAVFKISNIEQSRVEPTRRAYDFKPQLAHFDDYERHIVGDGAVPPRSYAVEDRLLHIREC